MNMKRPRQQRIDLPDYIATLKEGDCGFTGILKGVSLNGFQVVFCPADVQLISELSLLDPLPICRNRKIKIVVSKKLGNENYKERYCSNLRRKHYRVTAYARWWIEKDNSVEVGFELPVITLDWKLFISSF
ncbi:MAG: hypothetical protein WGN25_05535 [Candidatus Electrothrix sp. GW3-4]|uniref:hypothetical protein n=1 Tax=Candidatus Electrothrix sp. GW3-4 TaxID=3126740 RepID=UPI0030D161BB